MFDNAGRKIEKFAGVAFAIGTVMIIIITIIVLGVLTNSFWFINLSQAAKTLIAVCILVEACILIFLHYIACLMMSGFGQLVNNTAQSASDSGKIVNNTEQLLPTQGQTVIVDNSIKSDELPDL